MSDAAVEHLLNFGYFLIGLRVGLGGIAATIWVFRVQQGDKFQQIASDLTGIRATLVGMAERTGSWAQAREERLLESVLRRETEVAGVTQSTTQSITEIVQKALDDAGVSDALQRSERVERQLNAVLAQSAERIVRATNPRSLPVPGDSPATARVDDAFERMFSYVYGRIIGDSFTEADMIEATGASRSDVEPFLRVLSRRNAIEQNPDGSWMIRGPLASSQTRS